MTKIKKKKQFLKELKLKLFWVARFRFAEWIWIVTQQSKQLETMQNRGRVEIRNWNTPTIHTASDCTFTGCTISSTLPTQLPVPGNHNKTCANTIYWEKDKLASTTITNLQLNFFFFLFFFFNDMIYRKKGEIFSSHNETTLENWCLPFTQFLFLCVCVNNRIAVYKGNWGGNEGLAWRIRSTKWI